MSYAVHQMQQEASLRPIKPAMMALWDKSIAVASISQLVAERTKVHTDVAFLTGLLHGLGSLYIMARAAGRAAELKNQNSWMSMLEGWQSAIGKAVLESWGFAEEMCEAVGEQRDYERKSAAGRIPGTARTPDGGHGGCPFLCQHRTQRDGLPGDAGARGTPHRVGTRRVAIAPARCNGFGALQEPRLHRACRQ
jgi:hypothetical protein